MKFLLCSHTGVFSGGAERSLLLLAEKMSKNNMDFVINIPDNSKELLNEIKKRNLKYVTIHKDSDKRSIHKISIVTKCLKLLRRLIFIYKMYRFIKTNNINIVYLNTLRTTSEYIATKLAGKKTVMHIRGFDTKSNFRFKLLFNLDRIITLNKFAKKLILKNIKDFAPKKVLIIPNGVQVNSLQDKKNQNKIIKIVFIGAYEFRKGVDYFFEIADELLYNFENIQIIHIGQILPKDEFSQSKIKKHTRIFEHQNYIELGFKNNVSEIINDFDIFLLTSRTEGMPRSLLEAMERGLIPIVSDIGELAEVIRESDNGFLIDLNDMEQTINKIKKIISEIHKYQYISENARSDIEAKYNIENTNQKIIDVLTKWD